MEYAEFSMAQRLMLRESSPGLNTQGATALPRTFEERLKQLKFHPNQFGNSVFSNVPIKDVAESHVPKSEGITQNFL